MDFPDTSLSHTIPLSSLETLWEWHIPSDRLFLSRGALEALNLADEDAPGTMTDFMARIPVACVATLQQLRESVLNGSAGSFLESTYPFDALFVREHMIVLERNGRGRAIRVMGRYSVSSATASYLPTLTTAVATSSDVGVGYWQCRLSEGRIQLDNACAELLGLSSGACEFSLDDWKRRLHPEDSGMGCRYQIILDQPQMGDTIDDIVRVRRDDGGYVRVWLRCSILKRGKNDRALLMAGSLQNADAVSREGQKQQDNGRLLFAINATGDGIWDWDATTDRVYYSPRYLSMIGYTAEEFPGTLEVWAKKIHPDDYERIVMPQQEIVKSPRYGDTFECTYRLKKADGAWAWILGRGFVTHRDENGRATRLVGLHTDVTNLQSDREKLEDLVKNDALTGLRSRTYCDMEMERMEYNKLRPISIISCDISGLKLINDYLGHAEGDRLLRKAATLLRQPLRATDTVARMGGDEFAVLLPSCTPDKAREILEKIEQHFEKINTETEEMPVFVSLGVACTESTDVSLAKAFIEADRNMLRDKAAARKEVHRRIKEWIESRLQIDVSLEDSRYEG